MFIVSEVRHPFLLWVAVELTAEKDMSLSGQRLSVGGWVNATPRPPGVESRSLRVKAGQTFIIKALKSDGFRVGERVPLERVANKRPFNQRWQS